MRPASFALAFGLCLSLAAFAGCGGNVSGGELVGIGGSGATGSGGSGASGGTGATGGSGGGGQPCGPTTCNKNEVCCNASCGICVPKGSGTPCTTISCTDAGPPVPCGPTTCSSGEYCCNADCGVCAPLGAMCPQVDCAQVDAGPPPPPLPCGNTSCTAGQLCCNVCGQNVCVSGPACPSGGACAVDCSPQDAQPYGKCNLMFGYRWDGGACVPVGGCSCQGADCGNLFPDQQSCYQAYQSCPQYYN